MTKVTIYTTPLCGYCAMAKRLLAQESFAFEEIDVGCDWAARERLIEKTGGRRTVPQIWIGEIYVGGFDELSALERAGTLDPLLAKE